MTGDLEGIRVIDFTRLLPGPAATRILAAAGAEVMKVEPPGGEPTRNIGPMVDGSSAIFTALNRGKKTITADLHSEHDRRAVWDLIAAADVLVEGFRPGVMDRMGFGYDAVSERNSRIVYASLSGFGQSGPYANRVAHDINYMGLAGALSLVSGIPGFQMADMAGAHQTVIGILLALAGRERTGLGRHIDITLARAAASMMTLPFAVARATGKSPECGNEMLSGRYACYRIYQAADGRWLAVGALEPKFWASLCSELGCEEFIPRQFAEGEEQRQIQHALEDIFRRRTSEEWEAALGGKDVCVTRVLTVLEAAEWLAVGAPDEPFK